MFKFGFELEGFVFEGSEPVAPPKEYPTDGFPGLVEARTYGYASLAEAYARLIVATFDCPSTDFHVSSATFSPRQRAILRRLQEVKSEADIQNIYGRDPQLLGNRTIASLQINLSNLLTESRTDDKGVFHSPRWGLFDVPRIIRALDEEFKHEIKDAKRQPGEYCIKDIRLEYRSLPNFVFEIDPLKAKSFLDRVDRAVKGEQ